MNQWTIVTWTGSVIAVRELCERLSFVPCNVLVYFTFVLDIYPFVFSIPYLIL